MPGAGKSTVGVVLAKRTSRDFVDTDVLIQTSEGRTLQDIVDVDGYLELRKIEERLLLELELENCVIATGGSAAYSEPAMKHLAEDGTIVFLDAGIDTLKQRVGDYSQRGLAKRDDQSFEDLFEERFALYNRYSDITIDCGVLSQEQVCEMIVESTGGVYEH
jgi:shikimate kinase